MAAPSSVRIAVVGDVHDQWNLEEDTKALQFLKPDLVLFTGDFGNENVELVQSVANLEFAKAVILGNHDSWKTQQFSGKRKDNIQLQLECLGQEHVAYRRLDFPHLKLTVVGGRPFSCGGEQLFRKRLLSARYGVEDMEQSTRRIYKAVTGAPEDHLIIFLAHNGPTGLGANIDDICGRDWVAGGGDHGDPDLAMALSQLKETTKFQIPLVVFGHMHKQLAHGNGLRKMIAFGPDNMIYLNGAIVPRVQWLMRPNPNNNPVQNEALNSTNHTGTARAFTVVEITEGSSTIFFSYTGEREREILIMATLKVPQLVPTPAEDAEQLHKAFAGWGTNEHLIISILAHRNASQRKLIRQVYAETYGEDLLKALDRELSSDFEKTILLWTLEPAERDAYLANEATKRFTSSNWVLMEIACTRSSLELFEVRQVYHAQYKKSLEEDVAYHTSGDFRKLLVPLVSSFRYEGPEVNTMLAKSEAKILHEKISEKAYSDEEVIRILTTRSKAQLAATLNNYNDHFGNAINKDLKADPNDDFLKLLRATIKCLTRPEKYFEKLLRLSINKLGTDERALTRVVTTRAEFDMERIKEEYQRRNTVPLDRAIAGDTSGDYEKMLLALIGHGDA